jgi:hypothetical protein
MKSSALAEQVKTPFGLTSAADLMASDMTQTFLIDGVLAKGQPAVLGGPMKSLKTGVSVDLVYSLATGTPFLGRFNVPKPVRVGLVSMESGGATIQTNARQVARSKDVPPGSDGLFIETSWHPRLPRDLDALREVVTRYELDVLVLDPLYLLLCESVKNAADIYSTGLALTPLTQLAADTGVTPILVHHTNKSVRSGQAPEMGDLTGAGIGAWGRQFLILNRRREYVPGSGHHELALVVAGSSTRGSNWDLTVDEWDELGQPCWRPVVTEAGGPGGDKGTELAVLKHLAAMPDGDTQRAVREALSLSGQDARKVFAVLNRDGLVEGVQVTRKNRRTYDGYRITEQGRRVLATGTPGEARPGGSPTGTGSQRDTGRHSERVSPSPGDPVPDLVMSLGQ